MMIARRTGSRPPPTKLKDVKHRSVPPFGGSAVRGGRRGAGGRRPARLRRHALDDDEPMPAVPVTRDGRAGRDVDRGGRAELVGLALGLDVDVPRRPAGIATLTEPVRPTRSTSRTASRPRPPERPEQHEGDREADDAEADADERGRAAVEVEDLGREEPADAEHRDEREERRHERDAADGEVDVEGVEDAAEDVVEEDA